MVFEATIQCVKCQVFNHKDTPLEFALRQFVLSSQIISKFFRYCLRTSVEMSQLATASKYICISRVPIHAVRLTYLLINILNMTPFVVYVFLFLNTLGVFQFWVNRKTFTHRHTHTHTEKEKYEKDISWPYPSARILGKFRGFFSPPPPSPSQT
jgi:hypothetical protein